MNNCARIRELKKEVENVLYQENDMSKFDKKVCLLKIRKELVNIIINPKSCFKCKSKSKDLMSLITTISLN